MNLIDMMLDYESGDLNVDDSLIFFQELIDTGLAWRLQGSYGRTAMSLIEDGLCSPV